MKAPPRDPSSMTTPEKVLISRKLDRRVGKTVSALLRFALGAGLISAVAHRLGLWGAPGSSSVTWGNMANFETYTKKLAPWCPGVILPTYPGLGSDHRRARPWPAPDRRTLAEAYSCPCRAAHFELRSFHDSGAWPPRTLEFLRLCLCIRFSIPWVIPRRGVIVQRA